MKLELTEEDVKKALLYWVRNECEFPVEVAEYTYFNTVDFQYAHGPLIAIVTHSNLPPENNDE